MGALPQPQWQGTALSANPLRRREVDIHHLGRALTETALDQPALFRERDWGLMTA